jgi:hypothetical protein
MLTLDLQKCLHINKLYLCERTGVLLKYPKDSCLGALYHQKFDLAERICTFMLEPAREFMMQLIDNWFLFYMMEPIAVPVLCANNTNSEWHMKAGITRQHLFCRMHHRLSLPSTVVQCFCNRTAGFCNRTSGLRTIQHGLGSSFIHA